MDVVVFTDTYLPTVNGVSYTVSEWKSKWDGDFGQMSVVYPDGGIDVDYGIATRSIRFPFYENFRVGAPKIRFDATQYDIVHAHTPFTMGVSGLLSAKRSDKPFILSYHTPIHEYADYLPFVNDLCSKIAKKYQNIFFNFAEKIIVPTEYIASDVRERTDTPVITISNGVDIEFFKPTQSDYLEDKIEEDKPVVGYTGRLGFEKNISLILEELGEKELNIVIGGDGPARESLEKRAEECSANVIFTGFVDRDLLPSVYSAFDVFAFPSPVETQGKVALESISCGTPVVGLDKGALSETIADGETGVLCSEEEFGKSVLGVLENIQEYEDECLNCRDSLSVEDSVQELEELYMEAINEHR